MIDIVCILDKSGSMLELQKQVISSFNEFVQEQDEGELTLVVFDTTVETLYKRVPVDSVKPLTEEDYYPHGMTALYDAIGTVLNDPQFIRSKKGILVIHTDGFENSSKEYTLEGVKELISKKKDWEILFFGADIGSLEDAKKMGIQKVNKYQNTKDGFQNMYREVSLSVRSFVDSKS